LCYTGSRLLIPILLVFCYSYRHLQFSYPILANARNNSMEPTPSKIPQTSKDAGIYYWQRRYATSARCHRYLHMISTTNVKGIYFSHLIVHLRWILRNPTTLPVQENFYSKLANGQLGRHAAPKRCRSSAELEKKTNQRQGKRSGAGVCVGRSSIR